MAGYCFRCDAPAKGEACPRCGSPVYREAEKKPEKRRRPLTVGEVVGERPAGLGPRAIVAIVAVALLLVAIAVVAASAAGVT
jgi:hypothetical protein